MIENIHQLLRNYNCSIDELSYFLSENPDSVKESSSSGVLPIHLALLFGHSFDIIRTLLDYYPSSIGMGDINGYLPLHYAVSNDTTGLDIISYLVALNPESLLIPNSESNLPIHLACGHMPSNVIRYLASCDRKSLSEQGIHGFVPVCVACNKVADFEDILYLAQLNPESLLIPSNEGDVLIHMMLQTGYAVENVIEIAKLCPSCLMNKGIEGYLPIHVACTHGDFYLDAIKLFAEIYPESLLVQEDTESTPLITAITSDSVSPDIKVIEYLTYMCPQCLGIADMNSYLPIHYIFSNDQFTTLGLIYKMVELYPESLMFKTSNNDLPLHLAIENEFPRDIIEFIASRNPESLLVYSNDGNLPLDLALISFDTKLPGILFRINPLCSFAKDENGRTILDRIDWHNFYNIDLNVAHRMLLNNCASESMNSNQLVVYHEMNWNARESVLHAILSMREMGRYETTGNEQNCFFPHT